jgi:hypothetical protein
MLAEDGGLARSGRWDELLAVIERHGDRALDFTWRHKGALAVATVLGRFSPSRRRSRSASELDASHSVSMTGNLARVGVLGPTRARRNRVG